MDAIVATSMTDSPVAVRVAMARRSSLIECEARQMRLVGRTVSLEPWVRTMLIEETSSQTQVLIFGGTQ